MDHLRRLQESLTPDELRLIHLRYGRGFTVEDIAVMLGLAPAEDAAAIARASGELAGQLDSLRERVRALGIELGMLGSSGR